MSATLTKHATIGGEPEAAFERSFAELAYAYMQDKAPALLDRMVGFQLVDRNEDNTKAAGIFGFRLGDSWAYAPVFFISGDLKGHELLYLKGQNAFVPLKENWVNYLLNRKPPVLGRGVPRDQGRKGVLQPDYYDLAQPPEHAKHSSHQPRPQIQDWARRSGVLEDYAKWCFDKDAVAGLLSFAGVEKNLPPVKTATDLKAVLAQDIQLVKAALDMCHLWPGVRAALRSHYGADAIYQAACQIKESASGCEHSRGVLTKPKPEPAKKKSILGEELPEEKSSALAVRMIRFGEPDLWLDDAERGALLRDGFVFRDKRAEDQASRAYRTDEPLALANPSETGVYDVLVQPGRYEELLVVMAPYGEDGQSDKCAVVRLGEGGGWMTTYPQNVFVRQHGQQDKESDKARWLDKLQGKSGAPVGSLRKGAVYIAVSPCGAGSFPFRVTDKHEDGCYGVDYYDYGGDRPDYIPAARIKGESTPDGAVMGYGGRDDGGPMITFGVREGTRFRLVPGGILYAPADVKVLELKGPPTCQECGKSEDECDCDWFCCGPHESDTPPIRPGKLADVQAQLYQKSASLAVDLHSGRVRLNGQVFDKQADALEELVLRWGLREGASREILAKLAEHPFRRHEYRVKLASPYLVDEQDTFSPGFPEPQYGASSMFGGATTQLPQEELLRQPPASPGAREPYQDMDPMLMQLAQQAEGSGRKELFDTSVIGGLLKSVREDSIIDRNLPPLMTSLDRIGRILFAFYWHNEEFADRYGKQDMPELEDTLRNAFEVVGDLVLYLKRKTVDPRGPAGEMGEPSIDQSAYN